jgi:hypothetical protein
LSNVCEKYLKKLNVEKAVMDNSAEGVSEAGDKDLLFERMDGEILSGQHAADD